MWLGDSCTAVRYGTVIMMSEYSASSLRKIPVPAAWLHGCWLEPAGRPRATTRPLATTSYSRPSD
jgi:hypothetical protein